jgi:hypothetical protein
MDVSAAHKTSMQAEAGDKKALTHQDWSPPPTPGAEVTTEPEKRPTMGAEAVYSHPQGLQQCQDPVAVTGDGTVLCFPPQVQTNPV